MIKNLQFLSNQADNQGLLPIPELIIFTKFRKDWSKLGDFLLKANFWSWELFYETPSTYSSSFW